MTTFNKVFLHSNGRDIIVIAGGEVYFVDPSSRKASFGLAGDIRFASEITQQKMLILGNDICIQCLDKSGLRWKTKRISWDGMRNIDRFFAKLLRR